MIISLYLIYLTPSYISFYVLHLSITLSILTVYTDALESTPENVDILTAIGLLHLKLGNNAKAFEFLGRLVGG